MVPYSAPSDTLSGGQYQPWCVKNSKGKTRTFEENRMVVLALKAALRRRIELEVDKKGDSDTSVRDAPTQIQACTHKWKTHTHDNVANISV